MDSLRGSAHRDKRDVEEVLETVDDHVRDSRSDRVSNGQTNAGNLGAASLEDTDDVGVGDVEHLRRQNRTFREDLLHNNCGQPKTLSIGRLLQQCSNTKDQVCLSYGPLAAIIRVINVGGGNSRP
jgi:hypothetical protein